MDLTRCVKVRNEKFGAVLFDTLNEKIYVTNESGKDILGLISEGLEPPAIAERLGAGYSEGAEQIDSDVARFVDDLQAAGLLVPAAKEEP